MTRQAVPPDPFYNREQELQAFERAYERPGQGLMTLLYGRRRLGKTYLLQRFLAGGTGAKGGADGRPHAYYLADQTTPAQQRLALAAIVLAALPDPGITVEELAVSWNAIFRHVSQHTPRRGPRFCLALDEFPYLMESSPELPSVLQSWWDREAAHRRLFVILCGSQLGAMSALGAESAPLFGRFNAGVHRLAPLRYDDAGRFYEGSDQYDALARLLMYGVFGGTPRYHAMVDTSRPPAEEITDLLLRPHGPLENEVRFLLGSQQIRDPAPYNGVLSAIARGATQFGRVQQATGLERGSLSFHLRTLMDLEWIERERPFGDESDRRALYRIADPFLRFWYRFVRPLGSELQFADAREVFKTHVEPYLPDYMGLSVFEDICRQWLERNGREKLGVTLRHTGRWWNRDGSNEIDVVAELDGGAYLFGECKWSISRSLGLSILAQLQARVESLPESRWKHSPRYVLFTAGAFTPELEALAAEPGGSVSLVSFQR